MSHTEPATGQVVPQQTVVRGMPSPFEHLITTKPPVLESLLTQLPTESILALYHTSSHLKQFFENSPTSWRYISMRLHQPAAQVTTPVVNAQGSSATRQSSNYALDQLLLYVIHPFSTRLTSLELDNTAVSGATLFQTVMLLRQDTLEHVSVRGCKNVSLKYHINPWLVMRAKLLEHPSSERVPGFGKLALKSLYTYRCRHHRRRPYLPSSLVRKESDSEPTHELVETCHKLGIWTDTAWCTTPGARCFRRRGYVTMRVPQDPRDVWVVFDRLWRSRNWLGPQPETRQTGSASASRIRKRKRDCRTWEFEELAMNGEPLGTTGDGKTVPAHARKTHRQFVEDIRCDNCSDLILERCEQCSVLMHCAGCRKTLCGSCAFDRPYLRNRNALTDDRNSFWWAPGCAVSPCSMQDQDSPPPGPAGNIAQMQPGTALPNLKLKWCCTEPVFSGGGGITFGSFATRDTDRIRAAPLKSGTGWEDPEFSSHHELSNDDCSACNDLQQIGSPLSRTHVMQSTIGGRWPSIDNLFQADMFYDTDQAPASVPRMLCDDCYTSDQWKIKCKACSIALCVKHDVRDRLKVRICGYKDLPQEKTEYKLRQKAFKLLKNWMLKQKRVKMGNAEARALRKAQESSEDQAKNDTDDISTQIRDSALEVTHNGSDISRPAQVDDPADIAVLVARERTPILDGENLARPVSPGSNSTGPPSRATSPTPSTRSIPATPEPSQALQQSVRADTTRPLWKGCQSFFCPSTRTPGDHRRRCEADLRLCAECKIYVCRQCTTSLPPPCPCKGCRVPNDEGASAERSSDIELRFFCPNCRWSRRKSGKCKRKISDVYANRVTRMQKRRGHRKPIEQRRSHQARSAQGDTDLLDDSYGYLSDFLGSIALDSVLDDSVRLAADPSASGSTASAEIEGHIGVDSSNPEELRQLADMGNLARDLIQRIQTLRQQLGPTSLAALALPDVLVQTPALRSVREQTIQAVSVQRHVHTILQIESGEGSSSNSESTHGPALTALPVLVETESRVLALAENIDEAHAAGVSGAPDAADHHDNANDEEGEEGL